MSFYGQIDVRVWGDDKFCDLSPLQPSGQALWLWLLLCPTPARSGLPGLILTGQAAAAELLGWEMDDFRRCWAEIEAREMAVADWKNRVVWLPNSILYQAPMNRKQLVFHRRVWDVVKDRCSLKLRIRDDYRERLAIRRPEMVTDFDEVFGNTAREHDLRESGPSLDTECDTVSDSVSATVSDSVCPLNKPNQTKRINQTKPKIPDAIPNGIPNAIPNRTSRPKTKTPSVPSPSPGENQYAGDFPTRLALSLSRCAKFGKDQEGIEHEIHMAMGRGIVPDAILSALQQTIEKADKNPVAYFRLVSGFRDDAIHIDQVNKAHERMKNAPTAVGNVLAAMATRQKGGPRP